MTSQHLWSALVQLGAMALKNRVTVAPMMRISATEDGRVTDSMIR